MQGEGVGPNHEGKKAGREVGKGGNSTGTPFGGKKNYMRRNPSLYVQDRRRSSKEGREDSASRGPRVEGAYH